jgi:hypothetical protein
MFRENRKGESGYFAETAEMSSLASSKVGAERRFVRVLVASCRWISTSPVATLPNLQQIHRSSIASVPPMQKCFGE